ncbi:type III secretory pathway component EscS [Desulfitispora alkaliphila]|uniref:YtrH family sporulation protein n=1 Tax=Desulfitispora alkaliphila TaxID=622674 RepID=UPI003D218DCF
MENFPHKLLLIFFTSLGVVMGAALIGSIAALFTSNPPVKTMIKLANEIKIWAMVAAIGGTFTAFEVLELGIFEGKLLDLAKQVVFIISAFLGAQVGEYLVTTLAGGR